MRLAFLALQTVPCCGVARIFLTCWTTQEAVKTGKSIQLQAWIGPEGSRNLTFWRRNYFFLNFSTPCI